MPGFPGGSDGKESACDAGDSDSIPESGRSPGEGNGNPLQYSCLENPMAEEPGGLQSMGSQSTGRDWVANNMKAKHKIPESSKIMWWTQLKYKVLIFFSEFEKV